MTAFSRQYGVHWHLQLWARKAKGRPYEGTWQPRRNGRLFHPGNVCEVLATWREERRTRMPDHFDRFKFRIRKLDERVRP